MYFRNNITNNCVLRIINSEIIKAPLEEKYGGIGTIKIKLIDETQIIKIYYERDGLSDGESVRILNEITKEFIDKILSKIYGDRVHIIDDAVISYEEI